MFFILFLILIILIFLVLNICLMIFIRKKIKGINKIIFWVAYVLFYGLIIFSIWTSSSISLPPQKDIAYATITNKSTKESLKISKYEAQNLLSKLGRRLYIEGGFINSIFLRYKTRRYYNLSIDFYDMAGKKVLDFGSNTGPDEFNYYLIGINNKNYKVRKDFYYYLSEIIKNHSFDVGMLSLDSYAQESNSNINKERMEISWHFRYYTKKDKLGVDYPYTEVFLIIVKSDKRDDVQRIKVGDYIGEACRKGNPDRILPKDTIIDCQSYYAGEGNNLYVTKSGNKLTLKWQQVFSDDEDDLDNSEAEIKDLKTIEISEDVEIQDRGMSISLTK